ncbi:MAG: sialate O-acetylesterase, partial [Acidobacteriota bacterium]|nr:sialate O-acetylesterase [Acidobacteriota bacterium]
MSKSVLITLFFCLFLASAQTAHANLSLARLFSDHAVLQRGKQLPVWGWTDPGESVTVSIAGQT